MFRDGGISEDEGGDRDNAGGHQRLFISIISQDHGWRSLFEGGLFCNSQRADLFRADLRLHLFHHTSDSLWSQTLHREGRRVWPSSSDDGPVTYWKWQIGPLDERVAPRAVAWKRRRRKEKKFCFLRQVVQITEEIQMLICPSKRKKKHILPSKQMRLSSQKQTQLQNYKTTTKKQANYVAS